VSASAAESLEQRVTDTPINRTRWQAIQDALEMMPDDSLRVLLNDLGTVFRLVEMGEADETAFDELILTWYQRALFAEAHTARPFDPQAAESWLERSFGPS